MEFEKTKPICAGTKWRKAFCKKWIRQNICRWGAKNKSNQACPFGKLRAGSEPVERSQNHAAALTKGVEQEKNR